jgi:hypothetical protein
MNKIITYFITCFSILPMVSEAQIIATSNQPSETYSRSRKPRVIDPSIYGVFAGRTPCQEFLKELNLDERPVCAKRKMGLILYYDAATHAPTFYESHGMGKWTGKGKWYIVRGTTADPDAFVFQLELDATTSLFLLKGDDNVLFILDRNKNFLVGNANHSYTFNRVRN